ncbi:hypothetical protein [Cytobacillus purgationiresistens]|uniref:Uncharacterized protein n=1 Tax=Cytobacillus purgationiresistens TaxID=863449 RepID=A0ABU0AG80_9BACI|nr:hypothetical protein [Cytobacillus purgationiresistens]MDQ0270266.1 hypothetical protein [Cytobacillus purgationiresistens]
MQKRVKISIIILFTVLLCFNWTHPATAAAEKIKISVEAGFDGKVKSGEGFPLRVVAENSGGDFSGYLLVEFYPTYNAGGSVPVKIELPANSSKSFEVALPGVTEDYQSYNQNEPTIHLFKGDWRDGKAVPYKGDKTIKPKFIDIDDHIIGVLSEQYDRLKELRVLPKTQTQLVQMKEEHVPKHALSLETLDVLLIDKFAVSALSEEQQAAISEWIAGGGVFIAGGTPNASQFYGPLYSLLPLQTTNETKGDASFLNTNKDKDFPIKELQLFTGELEKDATVLAKSGETPAVVKKSYGQGIILQTAFSLGDEPLSSWSNYSDWFEQLLKHADISNITSGYYGSDMLDQLYWDFAEVNEYFPSSSFSIGQLIALLAGYIILVVPILYFILRKLDKREQAWWIIPSISILMAVVIFTIGAKDRLGNPQLNQMGFYIQDGQQLKGYQAATTLANNKGSYTVSYPKNEFTPVMSTMNSASVDPLRGAVMEKKAKRDSVVFPSIEYWSAKTVYGPAQHDSAGSYKSDLTFKNGVLTGTIENLYDYDFAELYLWTGNRQVKLGPVKKGETISVKAEVKSSFLTRPYSNGYGGSNQQGINEMKQERLFSAASNFLLDYYYKDNQPVLAGILTDSVIDIKMEDKEEKQHNLNLIIEKTEAKQEITGKFTLKNDHLNARFKIIEGQIHEDWYSTANNEALLEDGEYDYIYQLPADMIGKNYSINELKLVINSHGVNYSIYHQTKNEWIEIDLSKNNTFQLTEKDSIDEYISDKGEVMIKFNKNTNGDPYTQLPNITIKGELSP